MIHIDLFRGRPKAVITVASLAIIFSLGVTACAYPPSNVAEKPVASSPKMAGGVMAYPEPTVRSFVTASSQPGERPAVIIRLQSDDGEPLAGVELRVMRDPGMEIIAHVVSDSAGHAMIDLSAEKDAALERAKRSPDGQDTTNYLVWGEAAIQDPTGLWHYHHVIANFPQTFIDRERYLAYWMDETRRAYIVDAARGAGDLSLEDDGAFAAKMLADADLLEGEAITVLDVTPVSIPIQQGGRVIIPGGE